MEYTQQSMYAKTPLSQLKAAQDFSNITRRNKSSHSRDKSRAHWRVNSTGSYYFFPERKRSVSVSWSHSKWQGCRHSLSARIEAHKCNRKLFWMLFWHYRRYLWAWFINVPTRFVNQFIISGRRSKWIRLNVGCGDTWVKSNESEKRYFPMRF
jgi:hypothetical protein